VAIDLLGERTLRVEELEADVAEMKAIFREQLDEAARQLAQAGGGAQAEGNGKGAADGG
jgi:hypothetical protein